MSNIKWQSHSWTATITKFRVTFCAMHMITSVDFLDVDRTFRATLCISLLIVRSTDFRPLIELWLIFFVLSTCFIGMCRCVTMPTPIFRTLFTTQPFDRWPTKFLSIDDRMIFIENCYEITMWTQFNKRVLVIGKVLC